MSNESELKINENKGLIELSLTDSKELKETIQVFSGIVEPVPLIL